MLDWRHLETFLLSQVAFSPLEAILLLVLSALIHCQHLNFASVDCALWAFLGALMTRRETVSGSDAAP